MQHMVVIHYWCSRSTCLSHFQGSRNHPWRWDR